MHVIKMQYSKLALSFLDTKKINRTSNLNHSTHKIYSNF